MLTRPEQKPSRSEVELTLREDLLDDAKRLGIDISQACERGLEARIMEAKADRWYQENREAVDYWNRYVEENGLPLAAFRQF